MLRIGGVPEHFNLPWKLHHGNFTWQEIPGGTGKMAEMLENQELDIAIMLTEGAVKAIYQGLQATIGGLYVESPLIWGVHTGSNVKYPDQHHYLISRHGSGSHLMAFLWMEQCGLDRQKVEFTVCDNIKGALEQMKHSTALFLWEKFMTSPYVSNGQINRIGEIPTPWPCFTYVISNRVLEKLDEIRKLFEEVYLIADELMQNREALASRVAADYQIQEHNAIAWSKAIKWADPFQPYSRIINEVKITLQNLGITD